MAEEMKKNNTGSKFVLNCNVPQQYYEDLVEWYDDCRSLYNNNRWNKIWHDHVYVKDLKNLIINIQVELSELKSELKDLKYALQYYIENNNKEGDINIGLMK